MDAFFRLLDKYRAVVGEPQLRQLQSPVWGRPGRVRERTTLPHTALTEPAGAGRRRLEPVAVQNVRYCRMPYMKCGVSVGVMG
ncbi:hypothetical protein ACWCW7_08765 [Nocardia tengchongensis]